MQSTENQIQIESQVDLQVDHRIIRQDNFQTSSPVNSIICTQYELSFSFQVNPQVNISTNSDSPDKLRVNPQGYSLVSVQVDHQDSIQIDPRVSVQVVSVHDGPHFGPSDGSLVGSQDIYLQLINDLSENQPRPGESIRQQETSNQKLSCQSNSKTEPCNEQIISTNEASTSSEVLPDDNVYDLVDDSQESESRPSVYNDRQCSSNDYENYEQGYMPFKQHTLNKRKIIYVSIGVAITTSAVALIVWLAVTNIRLRLTKIDSKAHRDLNAISTTLLELSESQTSRLIAVYDILEVKNFTRSLWKTGECLNFNLSSKNDSVLFAAAVCPKGFYPMHMNHVGFYLRIISMPSDSLCVLGYYSILMANGIYTNHQNIMMNFTVNNHLSSDYFVYRGWVQDAPNVLQLNDSLLINVILSYLSSRPMQHHSISIDNKEILGAKQVIMKYNWTLCDAALYPGQHFFYYSDTFPSKHFQLPKFYLKINLVVLDPFSPEVAISCCYRPTDSPFIKATVNVDYNMSIFDDDSDNRLLFSGSFFSSYATLSYIDPYCPEPSRLLTLKKFVGKGPCTRIQYEGIYSLM